MPICIEMMKKLVWDFENTKKKNHYVFASCAKSFVSSGPFSPGMFILSSIENDGIVTFVSLYPHMGGVLGSIFGKNDLQNPYKNIDFCDFFAIFCDFFARKKIRNFFSPKSDFLSCR